MASFKFSCPHCGKHVEAEEEWEGMEAECPHCGKIIVIHKKKKLQNQPQKIPSNETPIKQKSRKYKLIITGVVVIGAATAFACIWNPFISKPSLPVTPQSASSDNQPTKVDQQKKRSSDNIEPNNVQPSESKNSRERRGRAPKETALSANPSSKVKSNTSPQSSEVFVLKKDSLFSIDNGKIVIAGVKLNEKIQVYRNQFPASSRYGILGYLLDVFQPKETVSWRTIGYGDATVDISTNCVFGEVLPWGPAKFFITHDKNKEVLAIEAVFENSNDNVYSEIIKQIKVALKKSNLTYEIQRFGKTRDFDELILYKFKDNNDLISVAKNCKTQNFDPAFKLITGTYNHHILICGTEIRAALDSRTTIPPQDRHKEIDAYGFILGHEPYSNDIWQRDESLEQLFRAQGRENIRAFRARENDTVGCIVRMTPVTRKAYRVEILFKKRRDGSLSNTLAPALQGACKHFNISPEEIEKVDSLNEIIYIVSRSNVIISLCGRLNGDYVYIKIVVQDDVLKEKQ